MSDVSWPRPMFDRSLQAMAIDGGQTLRYERLIVPTLGDAAALAVSLSPDRAAGEDALQNAALKAWRKLDQLRDDRSARAWFLTIVVNECRSARRRRFVFVSTGLEDAANTGKAWPEGVDERADVREAMKRLRPNDRLVLSLRYLLDLSIDEVAEMLKVSPSAVKARTARALQRFQSILIRDGSSGEHE
jgi:RNA polymerase sigma-70 factor, ECF subfamily